MVQVIGKVGAESSSAVTDPADGWVAPPAKALESAWALASGLHVDPQVSARAIEAEPGARLRGRADARAHPGSAHSHPDNRAA